MWRLFFVVFIKGHIPWNNGKKGITLNTGRTHFKKGHKPWNKNFIGYSLKDQKIRSKKCKVCGKIFIKPYGFNIGRWQDVRYCSLKCFGLFHSGENAPTWNGGSSFEPYTEEWNKKLRNKIRERDSFTCQECGFTQKQLGYTLRIHHIDYDKKNSNPKNLISLCRSCHSQTNFNRNDWISYFNSKLQKGEYL